MKVILSVPDEGYSERTWWRLFWAYLMKVILSVPDEGYFDRTWWRLFQKRIVRTNFDIYVFIIFFYYPRVYTKHCTFVNTLNKITCLMQLRKAWRYYRGNNNS